MLKYKKIVLVDDGRRRQIFEEILREIDPEAAIVAAGNGLEMVGRPG